MERTILTPIGAVCLTEKDGALVHLDWGCGGMDASPLLLEAEKQLAEYFAGSRREFDLPLAPQGTAFQRKVWDALTEIPYGETRSYGEIAARIGNPKACRAVGMANNRNPLSILIPCHRVIGADGSLTGYAGGIPKKLWLLRHEGVDTGKLYLPTKGTAL